MAVGRRVGCKENFKAKISGKIQYCATIQEALIDADICFIFTEWDEIKKLDPKIFEEIMKTPIILDGRNCFDIDKMKKYMLDYISIGRPEILQMKK